MKADPYVVGVCPDSHGFHLDPVAASVMLRVFTHADVDLVVHIGDIADAPTLSKYPKDPRITKAGRIAMERKAIQPLVKKLDSLSRDAPVLTLGNHDARLHDYIIRHADELDDEGIDGLDFSSVYGIPDRWRVMPNEAVWRFRGMGFTHGTGYLASDAGVGALKASRREGGPIVMGHTHRLAHAHRTDGRGVYPCIEVGHISKPPHYTRKTLDSQQGFAVITFHGDVPHVELVRIDNGRAFYRGKVF